jgi:hypothetical protein
MLRSTSRLLSLALTVSLLACQDDGITGPADQGQIGTGKGFTLLLTDAPGDFVAAVVTISQVTLQGDGEKINLLDEPFTGDLLELRNEVAALVSGLELPQGSYSQLRLIIDGAYIEVETGDGTTVYASSPDYEGLGDLEADGDLQMPSMGQSGLKINLPGGQVEVGEGETIVMLDFDVEESFGHQAGKSGKWIMHPVIKATNVTFGGNALVQLRLAEGVTLPAGFALGSFKAVIRPVGGAAADTITFTDANGDGTFEAMAKGLVPGQYELSLIGPAGLLVGFGSTTFPLTVTVGQKATATQVITIASAALPGKVIATLKQDTALKTLPAGVALNQWKAVLTSSVAGTKPDSVAFSDANTDGTFEAEFANRAPGAYSLTLLPPAGVTATYDVATLPVAITLAAGATMTQPFLLKTAVKP